MSKITRLSKSPVAAAVCAALYGPLSPSLYAQAPTEEAAQELGRVSVTAEEETYKVEQVSSPKYTQPLLETPQTVQIVPRQLIEEQSLLSLRDILATVPGITFGAGEGGGGYGDSITLRGFTGSNDITVDGVRDSAQYTRSDPFNLEQVEVANGANSVYSGAGSVGGTINLVSKSAQLDTFRHVTAAGGTDNYARLTGDFNQRLGETTGLRVNVMGHRNDVPGRDVEQAERWGVAPSLGFGLGTDTSFSLAYLHQHDDNTPQYGVPTYLGALMPGVDREAYYGYRNVDRQVSDVDGVTLLFNHAFNERFALRNQTHWQEVTQLAVVDPPQGTFCLANSLQPTEAACLAGYLPNEYQPSGPRGTTRDTTNTIIINQTDLTTSFNTGPIEHTLVTGLVASHETYSLRSGNSLRNPGGVAPNPTLPRTSLSNPDSLYTGPIDFIVSGVTRGGLDNRALYAFDNLKFSERWEFNAGVRVERNEGTSQVTNFATPADGGAATPALPFENDESLVSYRAGLVFKPMANASVYLAYGNAQTPSQASVNGGCNATNCNVDPEKGKTYELGTKWDFYDSRLSLTASVGRNERSNYRVADPGNPGNPAGFQVLDGSARVDSLILGLAGRITDKWAVYANYSRLDSEVTQGASDFISSLGQDYTRGDPLTNVPKNAGSLWTTWDSPWRVQLGYGVTYQGKIFVQQHSANLLTGPLATTAGYAVHRAMAAYSLSRALKLQFNVNNILDKDYLIRLRTQPVAWATPGEARSFVLTGTYSF